MGGKGNAYIFTFDWNIPGVSQAKHHGSGLDSKPYTPCRMVPVSPRSAFLDSLSQCDQSGHDSDASIPSGIVLTTLYDLC